MGECNGTTLKNGRIVATRPMGNGAKEAFMQDGGEMSQAEWDEYSQLLARRKVG